MSTLVFEGETVNVGGMELVGTLFIEARATDGSFCHAFGTEKVEDVEFSPDGFVPDKEFTALDGQLMRALWNWIDANERQILKAYEKAFARARL